MSTSSVPTVLDALRSALAAYTGLSNVNVWTSVPGDYIGENIVLASDDVIVDEDALGIGSTARDETYAIPCEIWVSSATNNDADVEASIKECRDRVYVLFGYVESYLNDSTPATISSTCRDAQVKGHNLEQGPYAASDFNGRAAQIKFSIEVEAQKAP